MWLSVVLCYDGPFLFLWLYDSRMMFNMNGSIGSPYILVTLVNVSRFGPTSLCQPFLTPLQCFGCASSDQLTPSCLFFFCWERLPWFNWGPFINIISTQKWIATKVLGDYMSLGGNLYKTISALTGSGYLVTGYM